MDDVILTVREVAKRLHVHPRSVYRLVESGAIPAVRLSRGILRFRWSSVVEMMAELEGGHGGSGRNVDDNENAREGASPAGNQPSSKAQIMPINKRRGQ